jgi:hypothetical protein
MVLFSVKGDIMKVTTKRPTEKNSKPEGKLFFLSSEGETVRTVKVEYRRNFSVGYSKSETERLQNKYGYSHTYNIHDGGIVRHVDGQVSMDGAYDGYFPTVIWVNGVPSAGGWGDADDSSQIVREVVSAYERQ